jgi:hypothetical protein
MSKNPTTIPEELSEQVFLHCLSCDTDVQLRRGDGANRPFNPQCPKCAAKLELTCRWCGGNYSPGRWRFSPDGLPLHQCCQKPGCQAKQIKAGRNSRALTPEQLKLVNEIMAPQYRSGVPKEEIGKPRGLDGATVLNWLHRAGVGVKPRGGQLGRFKLSDAEQQEVGKYYQQTQSSTKTAQQFDISKPTVLDICRRLDIPIQDDSVGFLPWEELKARYEENPEVTLLALAKEHDVAYQTMRLGLSKVGCKFRPKAPEGNTRYKDWWEKQQAKLAEAERLRNLEGLDLKTKLRVSLLAYRLLGDANLYAAMEYVYPDSGGPYNAVKQLERRFHAVIEDEKKRLAKLSDDQQRLEAEHLHARLLRETSKPKKI